MQGDEHLFQVFLWVFRELCGRLGIPCDVETETWARSEFHTRASEILELVRRKSTGRQLADVLAEHQELLQKVSARLVAYDLAMSVTLSELEQLGEESFKRLPPERQDEIRALVLQLIGRSPWVKMSPN